MRARFSLELTVVWTAMVVAGCGPSSAHRSETSEGAEIRINGQLKGVTPKTVPDLDMRSANKLELRFQDYQPYVVDLKWPASGQITINANLKR